MNRDDILNMPAGREMDKLVAEKVMRWHLVTDGNGWKRWEDKDGYFAYGINLDETDDYEDGEDFHILHWHPSESVLCAWEVVLHEMENGSCPNLVNDDNGHWALSFDGANDIPCTTQTSFIQDPRLWCDTAPLAICRSALLAVSK